MASEVGQRASKGRGRWRTEFPWHANPTTSCSRQAAAERVFISPPCFKERRDQRDLNKVGEQWLGDLRRAGAMPTSSRRGNSNRIVYDMHAPFKLAGRAGAQGPVRQPCLLSETTLLHPTERRSERALLLCSWPGEFYRGNVNGGIGYIHIYNN